MGTRARIGLLRGEQVQSIYTHWDGYPSHHGTILLEHYSEDRGTIQRLIDLGDLSVLGVEIGQQHDFDAPYDDPTSRDWCKAYGRDRGEADVDSVTHAPDDWPDSGHEYEYLSTDEGWRWRERKYDAGTTDGNYRHWWTEWQALTPADCVDEIPVPT